MSEVMDAIFAFDYNEITKCDVMTAVLDGQVPDEGMSVEMGIAFERSIPIIGLKTDRRSFAIDEPINAMIWGSLDAYTESEKTFFDTADSFG